LIDDLSLLDGARRERVEGHLFLAAVLSAARTHTIRAVLDEASFYDAEHVALVQLVSERLLTELSLVEPPASRSGELQEAMAIDGLEAMLAERGVRQPLVDWEEPEAYLSPRWSAPGRRLALAALTAGRRPEVAPSVNAMLHEVACGFEIMISLGSIHADLLAGRPTYPIAVVARRAGLPAQPWPDATLALGALVATNSLRAIVEAAISRIREGRRQAIGLGLATFGEYLLDVEARLEERRPRPVQPSPPAAPAARPPAPPLVTIARPTLDQALEMAEGFLVSDLTFRESWESHREGMFGSPAVASHYPAGLILEILRARGLDVGGAVDGFLAFTASNGFRYYDHPWSEIDSDTLGVYLRLLPPASGELTLANGELAQAVTGQLGQAVTPILACVERDVAALGRVPVWIRDCEGSPQGRPAMLDLGEGCGTVGAHLLLGLLGYAPDRYADTIERGALELLGRIEAVGLGANVNYPPVYALATFGRLVARFEGADRRILGSRARPAVRRARRVLAGEFERAKGRTSSTAQQAALLTIAGRAMDRSTQPDPRWQTTILKRQRFDGSWIGEPFAAAPNRGVAVTWYSSTQLTSALCYDALLSFR
jgi:hypothetical protein